MRKWIWYCNVVPIGVNHMCPMLFQVFSLTCRTGSVRSNLTCKSVLHLFFYPKAIMYAFIFALLALAILNALKDVFWLTGLIRQEKREVWVKWRSPLWLTSPRRSPKITVCWKKMTESHTGEAGCACHCYYYSMWALNGLRTPDSCWRCCNLGICLPEVCLWSTTRASWGRSPSMTCPWAAL